MPATHSVLVAFAIGEAGKSAGPNGDAFLLRSSAFGTDRASAGTYLSATTSAVESALP